MITFILPRSMSGKLTRGMLIFCVCLLFSFFIFKPSNDFEIPLPDGKYKVGTTHLFYTDSTRSESFEDDPKSYREVYAQAWYPAEVSADAQKELYLRNADHSLGIITSLFRLEADFFDSIIGVLSNAFLDQPVSKAKTQYPLLLFQHGYSFWVTQNTPLMEHLASNGYIVVSIGHPYETCYSINSSRELTAYSFYNQGLQSRWKEILNEDLSEKFDGLLDAEFSDKTLSLEIELLELQPGMMESVKIWSDDARFLLDQLLTLNDDHILHGRIDGERIGALGMSFGGAATAQLVNSEPRVKAGINLDGSVFGDLIGNPLKKPFMFVNSGNHRGLNEIHFRQSQEEIYKVIVDGAKHLDFCDLKLIAPQYFQSIGYMGSIDQSRIVKLINELSLSFFDAYLNDDFKKLDKALTEFPELKVTTRNI